MTQPITYLKGYSRKKDSAFESICSAAGGGTALAFIGVSPRDFPESRTRAEQALAVAKRQPRGALGRWLKLQLIRMQYNWSRRYFTRHHSTCAVCWNGITGSRRVFMEGARDAGVPTLFAELAPLPGCLQLDPCGVNASSSLPKDADVFRAWATEHPEQQQGAWDALGAGIMARKSRRRDVEQRTDDTDFGGPFLFVPLQVPNDSQITVFGGWTGSAQGFIDALAQASLALPDGWHLRLKEHPSAKTSLADDLERAVTRSNGRIKIDNSTDTFVQIAASCGVVTLNSSVGLQTFFYHKPVVITGQAMFGIEGLVHVASNLDQLSALCAQAENLAFDDDLRGAFVRYLRDVHFVKTSVDAKGYMALDPQAVRKKIAQAKSCVHAME